MIAKFDTLDIDDRFNLVFNYILIDFNNDFTAFPQTTSAFNKYDIMLQILYQHQLDNSQTCPEKRLYDLYKLIESYYIQKYPKEKIKQILNWLHYDDIELDFELEDMTPLWYINKIFIEPLYDKYHSQEYYDFINIFGPDETIIEINNTKILEDSN